jgi:hypothetical protein
MASGSPWPTLRPISGSRSRPSAGVSARVPCGRARWVPSGRAYEVWLPSVSANGHSTFQGSRDQGTHGQGEHAATMLELVHLVGRLQADLVAKAEAAAPWQARAELLQAQVEQLCALPAPPPDVPQDALRRESGAVSPDRTPTPAARHNRPWWASWQRA